MATNFFCLHRCRYPWNDIKPLIRRKVEKVLDEFHEAHPMPSTAMSPPFNYEELKKDIVTSLDSFSGAPFTIQRICELLTLPTRHYKRTDKFMRGLEKNVLVVSHIEPRLTTAERTPSPPKSIFAPDPYLFDRPLNSHDGNAVLEAGPSTSGTSIPSTSSALPSLSLHDSIGNNHTNCYSDPTPGTSSSSSPPKADKSYVFMDMTNSSRPGSSQMSSSSPTKLGQSILMNMEMGSSSPAPLQQLDSFTTVFSSPPSTPLAVVSNMPPFESASSSSSSSSSSGSSAESSPQPDPMNDSSPEPQMGEFESEQSFEPSHPSNDTNHIEESEPSHNNFLVDQTSEPTLEGKDEFMPQQESEEDKETTSVVTNEQSSAVGENSVAMETEQSSDEPSPPLTDIAPPIEIPSVKEDMVLETSQPLEASQTETSTENERVETEDTQELTQPEPEAGVTQD